MQDFNPQEGNVNEAALEMLVKTDSKLEREPDVRGDIICSAEKSCFREVEHQILVKTNDAMKFDPEEKRCSEKGHEASVKADDKFSEEPEVGMEFDSEEHAYQFYNNYAEKIGFSVRRAWVCRFDDGVIAKRTFCCYKQGRKSEDKRRGEVKYTRPATRTQCLARTTIRRQKNGKYRVFIFVAEHNHDVVPTAKTHLLRSYRGKDVISTRYNNLCQKFFKIAAMAVESDEAFELADRLVDKFYDEVIGCIKRSKKPSVLTFQATDESAATENMHQQLIDKDSKFGDNSISEITHESNITSKFVVGHHTLSDALDNKRKYRPQTGCNQLQKVRERNGLPVLIPRPSFLPAQYPFAVAPMSYFSQGQLFTVASPFMFPGGFYTGVDHRLPQLHQNSSTGSMLCKQMQSSLSQSDENKSVQSGDHQPHEVAKL